MGVLSVGGASSSSVFSASAGASPSPPVNLNFDASETVK